MGTRDARAWHRREGEEADAYRAFLAYCELGDGRTVARAWRAVEGRAKGGRQPAKWDAWAIDNQWERRAADWDNRHAETGAPGKRRFHRRAAATWYRRRELQNERAYRFGLRLLRRAESMIRQSEPARGADGNVAAAGLALAPLELKQVLQVGVLADAMVRDACTRSLPQVNATVPGLSVSELAETPEVREEARKDIESWREAQMPAILDFLAMRNPLDGPQGDAFGPGNLEGAPRTPPTSANGTG